MALIRDYVSGIVVASILSVLLEQILPQGNMKKYIRVAAGLVIMLMIIGPMFRLLPFHSSLVLPDLVIDDADLSIQEMPNAVAAEFEQRLGERLEQEVRENLGKNPKIRVSVLTDESGKITEINEIRADPCDEATRTFLSETVGIAQEKIREGELWKR